MKVLDFGVAQTAARVDTEAGAVRGTYAYMGPEQVRGKPLDKRADVFALGVILWELTTARRLFRGSDIEIMTSIVERDVPPPSRHVPNYPAELEHIVLHALQRDRGKRTASAATLAVALDLFCMRHGVASGALVVSQYVRSRYPCERAHEKGMGIARESGTEDGTGRKPRDARAAVASPEDLEAKLVAAELRALGHSTAKAAVLPAAAPESELLELTAEDLVADDDEADAVDGRRQAAQLAPRSTRPRRLRRLGRTPGRAAFQQAQVRRARGRNLHERPRAPPGKGPLRPRCSHQRPRRRQARLVKDSAEAAVLPQSSARTTSRAR